MQEKILRATAKIISSDGIKSASTRAICDAVGITAPTLYYYFKDKTELFDAVTQFAFEIHRENKRRSRTDDAFANLRLYWNEYMQFCLSEPELHRTMMVAITEGRIVKTGYACFTDLVAEFKTLEATGILKHSALHCAQMYLGAAQGISMILMSTPKTRALPALSDSTRDVVLAGLVKND